MKTKKVIFIGIGFLLWGSFLPALEEQPTIIGKLGGEGELIYPTQVEEGPDGNIYVYDALDAFIKVYTPTGKFIRRIGGEGQGPGEIQRAGGVRFGFTPDDKLYFTEFIGGHRWITIMELSGILYETIKLQIPEVFGVSGSYPLREGGYLLLLSYSSKPQGREDYFLYQSPRELVRIGSQGEVVSKLKRTSHITRISYHDDGADSPIPFTPHFAWCPYKGQTVLFTEGLNSNLQVYDYEGELIREIKTPLHEPEKVTRKDLDRWRDRRKEDIGDQMWFNRFGTVIEKYKKSVHAVKPNLSGLFLTPEGNILIPGVAEDREEDVEYWLLDDEGKSLLQGRTGFFGLRVTRNFVFYGMRDEEENNTLYVLRRKGTEVQDLKRILK
jgi:hypothetical protein